MYPKYFFDPNDFDSKKYTIRIILPSSYSEDLHTVFTRITKPKHLILPNKLVLFETNVFKNLN